MLPVNKDVTFCFFLIQGLAKQNQPQENIKHGLKKKLLQVYGNVITSYYAKIQQLLYDLCTTLKQMQCVEINARSFKLFPKSWE